MTIGVNFNMEANSGGNLGSSATLNLSPVLFIDTQNWATGNVFFSRQTTGAGAGSTMTQSWSVSLGLYSLTGTNLTLVTSMAGTSSVVISSSAFRPVFPHAVVATATTTVAPGQYWYGYLWSTAAGSTLNFSPANAYSRTGWSTRYTVAITSLVGGNLATSTNTLPASIASSDITRDGASANITPFIVLNS